MQIGQNGRFMGASFSPDPKDLERYRSLRVLSMRLSCKLIRTIPPRAWEEIGEALGILHGGALILDKEDVSSVLTDCCLYDWFENGRNLVQRYAAKHSGTPGTGERYLLHAYLQAKFRILVVQSAAPGAGVYCQDVLSGEELFMMDVGLSRSVPNGKSAIATRTIPLGDYWMTGGAALPVRSGKAIRKALDRIEGEQPVSTEGLAGQSLKIIRACLTAGAADYIRYESPEEI